MRYLPLLLLFTLVMWTGCDSSDDPAGAVTVTGTIENAAALGGLPVSGATLTFTETSNAAPGGTARSAASTTVTTNADGTFSVEIEAGRYTVTIERPGYTTITRTVTVGEGFTLTETLSGSVTISGSLANSQDGQATGLGGARVAFLFEDALSGDPINLDPDLETLANADGTFLFENAPFGLFACVIYAEGFVPAVIRDIDIPQEGSEVNLDPAVVTERPPEGAYRIVLSWGETPRDLDSHLTGPADGEDRFHIAYFSRTFGDSNLDVDDTSSFGPETITLFPINDGLYRYSVHNYTNQSADGALGIAGQVEPGQAARVEVYAEDRLLRSYRAPAASEGDGNTWRVFEMTVNGDNVTFSGDQPDGLEYVTASSPSDMGTFVQGGWPTKAGTN